VGLVTRLSVGCECLSVSKALGATRRWVSDGNPPHGRLFRRLYFDNGDVGTVTRPRGEPVVWQATDAVLQDLEAVPKADRGVPVVDADVVDRLCGAGVRRVPCRDGARALVLGSGLRAHRRQLKELNGSEQLLHALELNLRRPDAGVTGR